MPMFMCHDINVLIICIEGDYRHKQSKETFQRQRKNGFVGGGVFAQKLVYLFCIGDPIPYEHRPIHRRLAHSIIVRQASLF